MRDHFRVLTLGKGETRDHENRALGDDWQVVVVQAEPDFIAVTSDYLRSSEFAALVPEDDELDALEEYVRTTTQDAQSLAEDICWALNTRLRWLSQWRRAHYPPTATDRHEVQEVEMRRLRQQDQQIRLFDELMHFRPLACRGDAALAALQMMSDDLSFTEALEDLEVTAMDACSRDLRGDPGASCWCGVVRACKGGELYLHRTTDGTVCPRCGFRGHNSHTDWNAETQHTCRACGETWVGTTLHNGQRLDVFWDTMLTSSEEPGDAFPAATTKLGKWRAQRLLT